MGAQPKSLSDRVADALASGTLRALKLVRAEAASASDHDSVALLNARIDQITGAATAPEPVATAEVGFVPQLGAQDGGEGGDGMTVPHRRSSNSPDESPSSASGGDAPKTAPVPSARSAGGGQPLSVPGGAVPDTPEPASADPATVEGADGRAVKRPTRKDHGSPVAVPACASVSEAEWAAALAQRDAALSRLKAEYPAMCAQMRDLIAEVTAADAAVRAVNAALPEGSPPIAAVQSRLRADVGAHRHASRPPDISKDVRMPSLLHKHKSAGWAVRSLIAQETYDG